MFRIMSISSSSTFAGSRNEGTLVRISPPGRPFFSNITTSYPRGARSFATASEAGPAPMQATRLPFFCAGAFGSWSVMSSRRSAATRFRRQIATGSSSTRVRRQAGSHGRSQVRPRMPGNTFDWRLTMYASENRPCAISRMYSGTLVWAGQAHWQSTTLWK